jgi:lipoyltransferase 1
MFLQKGIKTNATQSIPSPVMNLCEMNSHVKLEKLLSAIGWEYLRCCPYTAKDKGKDFIQKQRGFQFINPTDQWFPGKCSSLFFQVHSLKTSYTTTFLLICKVLR